MSAICDHCERKLPEQKRRRGSPMRFCPGGKCRTAYHNSLVKKGKTLIRKRTEKKVAPKKEPGVVDLYSIPIANRPQLLADTARKLDMKEEGPIVIAARKVGKAHRLQQMIRLGAGAKVMAEASAPKV